MEQLPETMTTTSYTSIPEFYVGQTIFITGVTGFLGKVLLEKLLRSCPGIHQIYVLMRPKRGHAVQERLDELLNSQLFDRIRSERGEGFKSKLSVMAGDLMEEDLGISTEDRATLADQVNIVFHSAASVRFDDPLKSSVQLNLKGVVMMLELAREMKNLKLFLHVSTAYGNCDLEKVDEVIYPPSLHPQKILDAVAWMDEDIVDQITPRIVGKKPNTYTFTKQLAEYMISEQKGDLPVVILRPSIVCAAWADPIEGWVDNFNGASGVLASISKGLLRSVYGNSEAIADIIPVDLVVNMMIAAVWDHVGMPVSPTVPIPIYNCTTGQINGITWGMFEHLAEQQVVKYPANGCIRYPAAKFTQSTAWHRLNWVFDHQLPAAVMDLWMYVSGRRGIFVRLMQRISRSLGVLEYFLANQWVFSNDNVFRLHNKLSSADKKDFNFDARKVCWSVYIERYCRGIKQFALKEDMTGVQKAREHLKKLQRLSFMFNTVLVVILWRVLVKRVKIAHDIWQFMLNLSASLVQKVPTIARS